MDLGSEIKRLREAAGMTQTELAGDFTTASYVSLIERNNVVPSKKIITKIAARLGKPAYYFESKVTGGSSLELEEKIERLRALARSNKLEEAAQLAAQLKSEETDLWDKDIRATYAMALGYLSWAQNNYDDALFYYRQAYGCFDELGYKHKIVEALYGLGNIHARRNDLKLAVDYLVRALGIEAEEHVTDPTILYRIRLTYAMCLHRLGKMTEAREVYDLLCSTTDFTYQDRVNALLNSSKMSNSLGDFKKALEYSQEARKLAEEYADTLYAAEAEIIAATSLAEKGDLADAMDLADRAYLNFVKAGSKGGQHRAMLEKARLVMLMNRTKEAEELLKDIQMKLEQPSPYVSAMSKMILGQLYRAQSKWPEAIAELAGASGLFLSINRFELASQCIQVVAEIHQQAGDTAAAYNSLKQALELIKQSREEVQR